MPGMRLFGRRCALATDDFFFIGALEILIFMPWLAWIPVVYASYIRERHDCNVSVSLTDAMLPCLCALFLANWLIACFFLMFSVKGTIAKPEPRRHIVTLVYLKLGVSILDLGCAILGTVIMVNNSYCDIIGLSLLIKVSTIFQWVATLVRAATWILFYDWGRSPNGKTKTRIEKQYFTAPVRTGTMRRWNLRLQAMFLWCTTPSEARKEAIKTASELMALLSCDLDLVASDVIAGLLLYRQKCLLMWKDEKETLDESPPITCHSDGSTLSFFPPETLPKWMNLELARRYFDLGLGVFGWPWYIYSNITCGCCHLFKKIKCCFPCRNDPDIVLGDNLCGCNLTGLQLTTGLIYSDLVHASFVDRVYEVPFFVAYDHDTQAVVVTARGTMSLDDVLTDVAAGFAVMDDAGCPPGALCHHGMLSAAREILKKLRDKGILEKAFQERSNYNLIITGHSLGASVASILTMLLRESYPDVRCFAFAPSPTLNRTALSHTYNNVFTIVYGNDSVPYLNYENIKTMVQEMVYCLQRCNMPKFKVFLNNKKTSLELYESKENGKNGFGNIETKKDLESFCSTPCVTESLYVAGTILHIRVAEGGYRLRVSSADEYRPLAFRPNMIFHHFPQKVQKCLHRIGKEPTIDAKALFFDNER